MQNPPPNTEKIEEDLARFLGDSLSRTEINELGALAQYQRYSTSDLILAQGAPNNRLFFLIEGIVTIVRDGETIAILATAGEILGEMSLITQKVCSASIFASQPTELLVLDLENVQQLSLNLQGIFLNALNKLFSVLLAKKLATTNEKARLFEITNRELQLAKKALEVASTTKIDELTANQRKVFTKLKTVVENELAPIRDELFKLCNLGVRDPEVVRISAHMQRVLDDLEPLTKKYEAEGALRNKRVLLVEDDINEQINAKMSLGGTGVDFTVLADMVSAQDLVRQREFDIICMNSAFVDLISFARPLYPNTKYVFVTSEPISKHFLALKQYPELSTILARHPNDRTFTIKNIATTIRKLSDQDIFGLDKYLSWGTDVVEHKIKSSAQRAELVTQFEEYLDSIGIRGSLKSKGSRVLEELLMNAIYDAPTDTETGKPSYNHLDRQTPVDLQPHEFATLRYACDGAFLAISVVDSFGSLTRSTILTYLERCFGEQIGADPIPGKGGGGNGLFQIIQSSSLTVFNVNPRKKTEVIALLNINIQMQKISLHPSFHYFESSL